MSKYRMAALISISLATALAAGCSTQQTSQNPASPQQIQTAPSNQVDWSGDVDDAVTVDVQGAKAWTDNVTGKGVDNVNADFQGSLPASPVIVKVAVKAGRGQVAIVAQPTRDNNYTAAVRILDPESGKDHYEFVLSW